MRSFDERILTFENWSGSVSPVTLARSGFYRDNRLGVEDTVICCRCKIELYKWSQTDCVIEDHYKFSKDCPLAKTMWLDKKLSTPPPPSSTRYMKTFYLTLLLILVHGILQKCL